MRDKLQRPKQHVAATPVTQPVILPSALYSSTRNLGKRDYSVSFSGGLRLLSICGTLHKLRDRKLFRKCKFLCINTSYTKPSLHLSSMSNCKLMQTFGPKPQTLRLWHQSWGMYLGNLGGPSVQEAGCSGCKVEEIKGS